jgi:hypothetical protein
MTRDRTLRTIAAIICWFEELAYLVKQYRFERACALARETPSATKIVQTKVVDTEGYVLSTIIDTGHMEQMPNGGYRKNSRF